MELNSIVIYKGYSGSYSGTIVFKDDDNEFKAKIDESVCEEVFALVYRKGAFEYQLGDKKLELYAALEDKS